MNYLSLLTDDEARYICSVIPQKYTITYFQYNPKEFSKIAPGFRASTLGRRNIGELLFRNRNRRFISSYIETNITRWLDQIKEHIDECIADGDNKEIAYLHTLPTSFFVDNVALYFKLIGEEYPESYILLLASAVKEIKEVAEKQEEADNDLKTKEFELTRMQLDLDSTVSMLKSSEKQFKECSKQLKSLEYTISDIEKLKEDIQSKEETITVFSARIHELEKILQGLRSELSAAKERHQQLEAQIMAEMKKQQAAVSAKSQMAQKPLCPKDLDEFKDYLGYNLESIGVPTSSEYYFLLKDHLSNILFQGIPIIINRYTANSLIKCVANTLIGMANVETLIYSNSITTQTIDEFLSQRRRIVCLDNFLGNFNETELISLFDKHRDKVIFLTVTYDRTLRFVPSEFLKYCHYLNLNRIKALSSGNELTEDPSTLEEVEAGIHSVNYDSRYSLLLREILSEFGICRSLIEYRCNYISNEQDLCRILAFDVLPHCVDVLQSSPYNISERFVKYAGDSGRCSYKNLFKRWFA